MESSQLPSSPTSGQRVLRSSRRKSFRAQEYEQKLRPDWLDKNADAGYSSDEDPYYEFRKHDEAGYIAYRKERDAKHDARARERAAEEALRAEEDSDYEDDDDGIKREPDDDVDLSSLRDEHDDEPQPWRFYGRRETWKRYNEEEMMLFASMQQGENDDLSRHLYNAHAMKRKHYDPELVEQAESYHSKKRWRPAPEIDEETGADLTFAPEDGWTTWPLPPYLVPREGEDKERTLLTHMRDEHGADKPSTQMEEILTAVSLRLAKRSWNNREQDEPDSDINTDVEERMEAEDVSLMDASSRGEDDDDQASAQLRTENGEDTKRPYKREKKKRKRQAIFTADDDRPARLLQPTIRHTLTRLDELLLSLRESRFAALDELQAVRNASSMTSGTSTPCTPSSEASDILGLDINGNPVLKNSPEPPRRGRPRNVYISSSTSSPSPEARSPFTGYETEVEGEAKRGRGRPRRVHVPLPGETEMELRIRVAREMHKSVASVNVGAPLRVLERGGSASRSRSGSHSRSASEEPAKESLLDYNSKKKQKEKTEREREDGDGGRKRKRRPPTSSSDPASEDEKYASANAETSGDESDEHDGLEPFDWSDVLGHATILNFPSAVIQRTLERCTALFGESMKMHVHSPDVEEEMDEGMSDDDEDDEDGEEMLDGVSRDGFLEPVLNFGKMMREDRERERDEEVRVKVESGVSDDEDQDEEMSEAATTEESSSDEDL